MNNQAQQDKEQKKKMEATLLQALLGFLNRVGNRIRLYYDSNQQLYSIQNDRLYLQNILTKHYMRVQDRFMKNELKRLGIILDSTDENNLKNILYSKASMRAVQQSGYILKTMQKKLDQIGVKELEVWKKVMRVHFEGIVVNTETQGVAEETKQDVIGFSQSYGYLNHVSQIVRRWVTVLDGKEREAHLEALNQTKPFGVKFFVGGELLRYPGDPIGRPDNIINCRCTLLTSLE